LSIDGSTQDHVAVSDGSGEGDAGTIGDGAEATDASSGVQGYADGGAFDAARFVVQCVADAGVAPPLNPTVPMVARGSNGMIVSSCDPRGNLTEPVCEMQQVCGSGINPGCSVYSTGRVTTRMYADVQRPPLRAHEHGRPLRGWCT
jgi:hypothetical protein